jgi:hypothetical protein
MATQNGLVRRVEALEAAVPPARCETCAARPAFTMGGEAKPCPECGREPFVFTIDIDRASKRDDDAA